MNVGFVYTAFADINSLMKKINKVILNPLIGFLFALALAYFLFGLVQFLFNKDNEDKVSEGKQHMLWGVVGMFIMVGAFGIINFIESAIGVQ